MELPSTPSSSHCEKVVQGQSTAFERRTCEDVHYPNKKRRLVKETLSQRLVLSSDDSSEDGSSQVSNSHLLNGVVRETRLKRIKRRLYPETSTKIDYSKDGRPTKKKRMRKASNFKADPYHRGSKVLSGEDPSEERLPTIPRSIRSLPPSQPNKQPHCLGTLSQSVLISSSEDSDFELHNSRKSSSFLSQSLNNTVSPRPATSCFSSQMYKDTITRKVSHDNAQIKDQCLAQPTVQKTGAGLDSGIFNSTSRSNDNIKLLNQKMSSSPRNGLFKAADRGRRSSDTSTDSDLCGTLFCAETSRSLTAQTQNADLSSIYLQTTIPSSSLKPSAYTSDDDPRGSHERTSLPSSGDPIYNEPTIDPTMQLHLDSFEDSTDVIQESSLLNCSLIGPSDEDDEFKGGYVAGTPDDSRRDNRTSLSINRSELLDVTHISCSDDEIDEAHSENDSSVIGTSNEGFGSEEAFLTQMASLLVDARLESSGVITPLLNSLLGSSPDFFSDIASSVGTGGSSQERRPGFSGVEPENMTPDVASLAVNRSVIRSSDCGTPGCDESTVPGTSVNSDIVLAAVDRNASDATVCRETSLRGFSRVDDEPENISSSSIAVAAGSGSDYSSAQQNPNTANLRPCVEPMTPLTASPSTCSPSIAHHLQDEECSKQGGPDDQESHQFSRVNSELDDSSSSTIVAAACSEPGDCSALEDPDHAFNGPLRGTPVIPSTPSSTCSPGTSSQQRVQDCSVGNEPDEIRIVCGSSLPQSSPLRIIQYADKSLLNLLNPFNLLLLDVVISECQQFAEAALDREPLHTFIIQYSKLPSGSKIALHSCLLDLLHLPNSWVKTDASPDNVDHLVSAGIVQRLNDDDGLLNKLNALSYSEIVDIFKKLGNLHDASVETMKNIILNSFSSPDTENLVKKEVTDWINKRFLRLKDGALFCVRICLELFVMPLNICDRLINYGEIARYANTLIRDVSSKRIHLLPLTTSQMPVDDGVWSDLKDVCQLRAEVFETPADVSSLNHLCASLAVLDASTETDPTPRTPTSRHLFINTVHALDERAKRWLSSGGVDVEWSACVYLGFLLKQTAAGFPSKVKWCRERMKFLVKLLDQSSIFEQFTSALEQPLSQVDFFARSEFISGALNVKKNGLSLDEKSKLIALLRPITHQKAQIPLVQSTHNFYTVVTKKGRKNVNVNRTSIFEHYKSDFPSGVEDNGGLLLNTIYLVFWKAVYLRVEGVFLSRYQRCPVDWGSREFFLRREAFVRQHVVELTAGGLPAVEKLIDDLSQFAGRWSVVEWNYVVGHEDELRALVRTLGLDRLVAVGLYVLAHVDERVLGVPEMVLWNEETKRVKFLGSKKPGDPLYPYQVIWLEKLPDWGIEAEECQFVSAQLVS